MRCLSLLFVFMIFVGCNSNQKRQREYNDVKIGMLKSEVLEISGPPYWSDRSRGLDRWIYYLKPGDRQTEKIIYFKHGKVIRKGLREKPTLSAEEMDEIKKPRIIYKTHKPSVSDKELRKLIKKEIRKESPKKTPHYEKL